MNSQFPNLKIDCTFETRIFSLSTFIGNLNTFELKQIVLKLTIGIDKTRKLDWTFLSSDISQAKRVKEYANILIQITQTHTHTKNRSTQVWTKNRRKFIQSQIEKLSYCYFWYFKLTDSMRVPCPKLCPITGKTFFVVQFESLISIIWYFDLVFFRKLWKFSLFFVRLHNLYPKYKSVREWKNLPFGPWIS